MLVRILFVLLMLFFGVLFPPLFLILCDNGGMPAEGLTQYFTRLRRAHQLSILSLITISTLPDIKE